MAPRYLVDAERPHRSQAMQEQFRFFVRIRIKGQDYTRWFASTFERDNYQDQIPGAVVLEVGAIERLNP